MNARGDYTFDIDEKCACKNGLSHEVWGICFSVRYLLNFKCYKICVEEVPDYFVDKVVSFDTYLKKMNWDPFFFLCHKTRRFEVSLDNPYKDKIPARTDYRLISSS